MADGKSAEDVSKNLGKALQKTVRRTKEKMLESMGKANKTPDNEFDTLVIDFERQQESAAKLQKELKNYMNSVRAMAQAASSLHATVMEVYESDWLGAYEMAQYTQKAKPVWDRHLLALTDFVFRPTIEYTQRFADLKSKIAKRSRKLVDVDGARYSAEALQAAKKPDHDKIRKAEEELREKKAVFNELNTELTQVLPAFYAERVTVTTSTFRNLFRAEAKLYDELSKIDNDLADTADKLSKSSTPLSKQQASGLGSSLPTPNTVGGESKHSDLLRHGYKGPAPDRTPAASSTPVAKAPAVVETPKAAPAPVAKGDMSDDDMPKYRILHKTPSAADASNPDGNAASKSSIKPVASATAMSSSAQPVVQTPVATKPAATSVLKTPSVTSNSSAAGIVVTMRSDSSGSTTSTKPAAAAATPAAIKPTAGAAAPRASADDDGEPSYRILRKTGDEPSKESATDRSKKRRSTEPVLPALVAAALAQKQAPVPEEGPSSKPTYRILGKTRELVTDSSPNISEGEDEKAMDSDEGANLPEFRMLKESSMSFGPASSKNRNKRKSASFSQADSRLRGGGTGLDSRVPSKGRNPSGSSTKKAPTTSEELYKAPTNEPMRAPSKVLFQVKAIYAYEGEDLDELSFEANDVIDVIPFPDPEDQDEGWLMGVKQATGERGVFPENFTSRVK